MLGGGYLMGSNVKSNKANNLIHQLASCLPTSARMPSLVPQLHRKMQQQTSNAPTTTLRQTTLHLYGRATSTIMSGCPPTSPLRSTPMPWNDTQKVGPRPAEQITSIHRRSIRSRVFDHTNDMVGFRGLFRLAEKFGGLSLLPDRKWRGKSSCNCVSACYTR